MLPLIKVKFCQCWYIVCGIPWQSATSLLPLLRIFCGVTWCAVSSVFTEHRLQLCFRRGWWAVMAFLQRQERNKERSVLFHAFLYSTQVETCLCGWTPIAARLSLSLSAAGECHYDVQLFELNDGVTQLCWTEKEELKWRTEQLEITLPCLRRRKTHSVTMSYNLKAITPFKIEVHSTELKCTMSCQWFKVLHELLTRIKLRSDDTS